MQKLLYLFILATGVSFAQSMPSTEDPYGSVENVLPKEKVEPLINDSYALLSTAYTDFARLFNICQNDPGNEACDERFDLVKSCFKKVESNNTVLKALATSDLKPIHLPEFQLIELQRSLSKLGYIPKIQQEDDLNRSALMQGLSSWTDANDLPEANEIYLMHLVLVRSQLLALEMEETKSNYNN